MLRKHQPTEEEKIAIKMTKLSEGIAVDLDRIGIEIARIQPATHYNRLVIITESAVEEMEKINARKNRIR